MMKLKCGYIENPSNNQREDVIIKTMGPNRLKDIAIGGGAVLFGIWWLTRNAFKNGANALNDAELQTLDDVGCLGVKEIDKV